MANRDPHARRKLLEEENELLLAHLHRVQEELQHYFLLNRENQAQLARTVASAPATTVVTVAPITGGSKMNPLTQITDFLGVTIRTKIEALRASGFFDEAWYLQQYPAVAAAGKDPIEHYLRYGAAMGLNPNPHFDTRWYQENYPDVAKSRVNPLLHYIKCGMAEARLPSQGAKPGADISAYGRALEDLNKLAAAQASEIDRLERELKEMRDEQSRQLAGTEGAGIGRLVAWSRKYRRWQGIRAARRGVVELAEARDSARAIIDRGPGPDQITEPGAS